MAIIIIVVDNPSASGLISRIYNYYRSISSNNSKLQAVTAGRIWTPSLLQAQILIAIKSDCLRVSGLANDAVFAIGAIVKSGVRIVQAATC